MAVVIEYSMDDGRYFPPSIRPAFTSPEFTVWLVGKYNEFWPCLRCRACCAVGVA